MFAELRTLEIMWRKEEVVEELRKDQGTRSLRDYAENVIGCSPGYLSDVYNNRRDPGTDLLNHLNIEKTITVTYTPKEPKKWRK